MDTHLMIDTETAGTCSGVAPLAIAATRFTAETIREEFFETIDLASALGRGLQYEEDTLRWWTGQENFSLVRHDPASLGEALSSLQAFYDGDRSVWARGTDFDFGLILRPAFSAVGLGVPWPYSHVRDLRTVCPKRPNDSTHHPLEDCLAQVRQLQEFWEEAEMYERTMPPKSDT